MHTYTPRTFTLGTLEGLSEEQIKVHLGLYEGYVKHMNVLREQIAELTTLDATKYAFAITETRKVGPLTIESIQAKKQVSTGACGALDGCGPNENLKER